MPAAADRHLLFGLLVLQTGIINQGQLVAAFQAWTLDKAKSLADHPQAPGDLTGAKRALLEGLAQVHLEAHGGDVEKSLAAVSAGKSTRESLARIADPEINATRGHRGEALQSFENAVAIRDKLGDTMPDDIYNQACLLVQISKLSGPRAKSRSAEDRAMLVLLQAVAAGLRDADHMAKDSDLDPLRPRDDFRLLMLDLAFPAQPFAQ